MFHRGLCQAEKCTIGPTGTHGPLHESIIIISRCRHLHDDHLWEHVFPQDNYLRRMSGTTVVHTFSSYIQGRDVDVLWHSSMAFTRPSDATASISGAPYRV